MLGEYGMVKTSWWGLSVEIAREPSAVIHIAEPSFHFLKNLS